MAGPHRQRGGWPTDPVFNIMSKLAGWAAERILGRTRLSVGAGLDWSEARDLAKRHTCPDQADAVRQELLDRVQTELERPGSWAAIERIAADLTENECLGGRQAEDLFHNRPFRCDRRPASRGKSRRWRGLGLVLAGGPASLPTGCLVNMGVYTP